MIYISAQPDTTFFIWQLEIQLHNFRSLGIIKDQIQVLASYKLEAGLNPSFQTFIDRNNRFAHFYTYPDLREDPKYTSSIRPNILKQHFELYPELKNETLFYHDSDILFSRIPQIQDAETNSVCYVSDTRNYLDIDYIRRSGSEQLLVDMASIVGIPIETIEKNKRHTGGAQYILKGINTTFWKKVERDSEELCALMNDFNKQLWEKERSNKSEYKSKKRGIQSWCADMWAVLWNLWLAGKKVEIHPEMDFSWPYSPIEEWDKKAIQHYSGNIKEKETYFKKTEYLNYMPWYDEALLSIPDTNCSHKIVELIRYRKEELDKDRPSFPDSCIVFDGREFAEGQLENFRFIITYLQKHLCVDLYMLTDNPRQAEQDTQVNTRQLLSILGNDYERVLWIPLAYIPDVRDIQDILRANGHEDITTFFPDEVYKVDSLFVETFSKVLDMELLHVNRGKFNTMTPLSQKPIQLICLPKDPKERKAKLANRINGTDNRGTGAIRTLPVSYCFIP